MGKRRRQQQRPDAAADAPDLRDGEHTFESTTTSPSTSKRQATDGPLTAREIKAFIRDGFVLLKDAFAQDTAAKCRELVWRRLEQDGIYKSDSSTWVERHGIAGVCVCVVKNKTIVI